MERNTEIKWLMPAERVYKYAHTYMDGLTTGIGDYCNI